MASFSRSFSAASPVLTVSPQPAHQARLDMGPYASCHSAPFGSSANPITHAVRSSQLPPSHRNTAGRKRSRDEAAPNLMPDEPDLGPIEPIKEAEDDWEYGEGMVLIKRNHGYVTDASSQSGTWVDEKTAQEDTARANEAIAAMQKQQQQQQDRPSLRSHKSQRLDQSTAASPGMEYPPSYKLPEPGTSRSSLSHAPTPLENTNQPVVDDFTLHLGIGWRRISDDEHIQAAARGWAKYIENHYPVSAVSICLESKGLQSYLVEAAEGFYLFSEDLRQGRLVSRDGTGALSNLGCSPPKFDSEETLFALESPAALEILNIPAQHEQKQQTHTDIEMDMS